MLPVKRRSLIGRPSLYKPEYCGLVEQWGKEGKSQSQMCSLLNIGRATFFEWIGVHPDFAASTTRAREHAQAWWEQKAQSSLGRKQFQAQLWRYSMMGRFKEDYGEQRQGVDITLDLSALVLGSIEQGKAIPGDGAKVIDGKASSLPVSSQVVKEVK